MIVDPNVEERDLMKVGTKSLLFGAHCFFIHPWFVALAWIKVYGLKTVYCNTSRVTTSILDWRLWVCFLVHDWGYWGCSNMDGIEGNRHPEIGAKIIQSLLSPKNVFGRRVASRWLQYSENQWHDFILYHSRFLAKQDSSNPSLLCVADKLSIALEPWWLYLPRAILSGEIYEYMQHADRGKYATMSLNTRSKRACFKSVQDYLNRWAFEHMDGKLDYWTPNKW